jgi:hypothetical protein
MGDFFVASEYPYKANTPSEYRERWWGFGLPVTNVKVLTLNL